ncbi:hypothetical protein [Cryptosporangium sp. NPDC051539]|uniref:hypothetical protein n=1 Tax=Cryptosporangium sp. NPDC051539 TaxID=3363962 RepID=UPI0037BCC2FB
MALSVGNPAANLLAAPPESARAATRPVPMSAVPMSAVLRELRLECLDEWRRVSLRGGSRISSSPLPLIWASYGVVR